MIDCGEIAADTLTTERTIFKLPQFIDDLLQSRRAVDAAFACYKKSPDDAQAVLEESGEFTPAEVNKMLARFYRDAR